MCHLGLVALGDFALHHKLDYTYHNNSIMAYAMIMSMTMKIFISGADPEILKGGCTICCWYKSVFSNGFLNLTWLNK